jgi:NNP family nitrate/nitrite transporter-like MFS transporter
MASVTGNRILALWAATAGFFSGFAAVALFGPTASALKEAMGLSPMAVGFLVAAPALSGSLLRIPFSAWVDSTGGRKPFLVLLSLALLGLGSLTALMTALYPQGMNAALYPLLLALGVLCGCGIATFSVGISQVAYWFPQSQQGRALAIYAGVGNLAPGLFSLLLPLALQGWGLARSYLAWTLLLACGVGLYFLFGRNAPYFQLRASGLAPEQARAQAAASGQELFPRGGFRESLGVSARNWKTWALVLVYFATFGGFIALTAWLPTYFREFLHLAPALAGLFTALYSLLTSLIRVAGGFLADHLQSGGENASVLALLFMLAGALVMTGAEDLPLALPGIILLALGMGVCNAAVFKMVAKRVPEAVGGAAGWVGGLGAFGGFAIPPAMAFAVQDLGPRGYAVGFVVFVFLALCSLTAVWLLKYSPEPASQEALRHG